MIVDTSAIVAIILEEPESDHLLELLLHDFSPGAGTPTLVESGIVLANRLGPKGRDFLAGLIDRTELLPVTFGQAHWIEAVTAHERYGRGRHSARLNFGDCMTYAVAKLADEPLLTLDPGFADTDIALVD